MSFSIIVIVGSRFAGRAVPAYNRSDATGGVRWMGQRVSATFCSAGFCQPPLSASGFGQYRRPAM
ncbi:hypothetical protein D3C78_766690 [compost metagenome]